MNESPPISKINFESGAVQSYLSILQGVISRMASNSASCKTWCITIVSAIAVIVSGSAMPNDIWIAAVPIALFFFLDSYYLSLEKRFRNSYNEFIQKLHSGDARIEDVYILDSSGGMWLTIRSIVNAGISVSVAPFYGLLTLMIYVIDKIVL